MEIYFWNLKQQAKALELAAGVVRGHRHRFFFISEFHRLREQLAGLENVGCEFHEPSPRVAVLFDPDAEIRFRQAGKKFVVCTCKSGSFHLDVAALHLLSLRKPAEDKEWFDREEVDQILRYEAEAPRPVVLIGDFNSEPAHRLLCHATALYARDYWEAGLPFDATVQSRKRTLRYNPIAGLRGSLSPGPPGTFFYFDHRDTAQQWRVLDQAIVPPHLVPHLRLDGCGILGELDGQSLLDRNGRPDRKHYSDHLPIRLALKEGMNNEEQMG